MSHTHVIHISMETSLLFDETAVQAEISINYDSYFVLGAGWLP